MLSSCAVLSAWQPISQCLLPFARQISHSSPRLRWPAVGTVAAVQAAGLAVAAALQLFGAAGTWAVDDVRPACGEKPSEPIRLGLSCIAMYTTKG